MKSFCIIGMGRFGQSLAMCLTRKRHQVLILDDDEDDINAIADYVTDAAYGDLTNEKFLRNSGVANYECAIVAISGKLNDSIIITLLLKDMGIPKVVVRADSDMDGRVLKKIGADMVVYPEREMGDRLAYVLDKDNVMEYIQFSNEFSIVETPVPKNWIGMNLIELNVRNKYEINVIAVRAANGKMNISPNPKLPFAEGDAVTIIGSNKAIDKLIKNE